VIWEMHAAYQVHCHADFCLCRGGFKSIIPIEQTKRGLMGLFLSVGGVVSPPRRMLLSKIDDALGSGRAHVGKFVVMVLKQAPCSLSDLLFGDGFPSASICGPFAIR